MKTEKIKKPVREFYAKVAKQSGPCCAHAKSQCGVCGSAQDMMGYTDEELKGVPEGSILELGIGNPVAPASLRKGEIVLDLGSGAGRDCFIAANKVGKSGRVIGVDMTPEMVDRARENVEKGNYKNVEFRLGEIENLPVADNSVDVVLSNCVINLVPDKGKVFREMFRALKPGGRFVISDVVLLKELPDFIKNSVEAYVSCLAGAIMKDEYIGAIKAAGFQGVKVIDEASFPTESVLDHPTAKTIIANFKILPKKVKDTVISAGRIKVYGIKPTGTTSIY
jgi:arsenite methyltransferase